MSLTGDLPKPEYWQQFQDLTCDLYSQLWNDPYLAQNGRPGQRQHGVDIFGQPHYLRGKYAGIQCKRYEDGTLSGRIIKREIAEAQKFVPPLTEFIIVTTERRDANLQELVRKINVQRKKQKRFPVQLVFWEDLCSHLKDPLFKRFLLKYYGDWLNAFGVVTQENAVSISQVYSERDNLKIALSSSEERRLLERWEALRKLANAGYAEAIRGSTTSLLDDMLSTLQHMSLSRQLQGRVYRLAAHVFLPRRPGDDIAKSQQYLLAARHYADSDALSQSHILEAILALWIHGLDVALAMIEGLESPEVTRFRFSLYLQGMRFDSCRELLVHVPESELTDSKDWMRLLIIYYAGIGEGVGLESKLESLLAGAPSANYYFAAGLALERFANRKLFTFCDRNNVCFDSHICLTLDELVDSQSRQRASKMYLKAFETYQQQSCPDEALTTLEAAVRLSLDGADTQSREPLLEQLHALAPDHPLLLVALNKSSPDDLDTQRVSCLSTLLSSTANDLRMSLNLAGSIHGNRKAARRAVELLRQHEFRFTVPDDLYARYATTVMNLYLVSDSSAAARKWVETAKFPSRYEHLNPLSNFLVAQEHRPKHALKWLTKALRDHQGQPEVLAVATIFFAQTRDHERELRCARALFGLLRTSQTAGLLFNALLDNLKFQEFLTVADQSSDLHLPEATLQTARAKAYLKLEQPVQARQHLEWLRSHQEAQFEDYVNLARTYHMLGDHDGACEVYHECVARYPEKETAYVELSRALLVAGRRAESFEWAIKAREKFPQDPDVAMHLFISSFPTGFESKSVVQTAMRELAPGGIFENRRYLRQSSLDEIKQFIEAHQEKASFLVRTYQQGKISAMLWRYLQHTTLYSFHFVSARLKFIRYAAAGDQAYDTHWLREHQPQSVVIDYSALLTLWSLYEDDWLSMLGRNFQKIWIPAKLLPLLLWEQLELAEHGQPERYREQVAIRDAINRDPHRFVIDPARQPPTSADVDSAFAEQNNLLCFNEYLSMEEASIRPVVGIQIVAKLLEGYLNPIVLSQLIANSHLPTAAEQERAGRLSRGDSLVVDVNTLMRVAQVGALAVFVGFFGELHLSESTWQQLQGEIQEFDWKQEMSDTLQLRHRELGKSITEGFVSLYTVAEEQRLLSAKKLSAAQRGVDKSVDELGQLWLGYTDELISAAHEHNIPIWTDDRWTSKLYLTERRPPFIFGTDTFLQWKRQTGADPNDSYSRYGQLLELEYWGLPLNPTYVDWLLESGKQTNSALITKALTVPRRYVLQMWDEALADRELSSDFSIGLLSQFSTATSSILRLCHKRGISAEASAQLFSNLDLTHDTTRMEGREPLYYASLLMHFVIDEHSQTEQFKGFTQWVDNVMQISGVPAEVIQEAWFGLLQHPLDMFDSTEHEQDKKVAALFARRFLADAPEHVITYLAQSKLGEKLQRQFGFNLQTSVSFEITTPEGKEMITVPEETWIQDLQQATTEYLLQEAGSPITAGLVTIKAEWLSQGSIFLLRHEMPSEVYLRHPEISGAPQWVCILPAAYSADEEVRRAFWRQGLRKLELLGLPTENWLGMRASIAQDSSHLHLNLLAYWPVMSEYLREAVRLGPKSIQSILQHVGPETVRAWLHQPDLEWQDATGLESWAKTALELPIVSDTLLSDDCKVLINRLTPAGYSIFPDVRVWQDALCQIVAKLSDGDFHLAIWLLLKQGEKTQSLTLKANIVIAILGMRLKRNVGDLDSEMTNAIKSMVDHIVLASVWPDEAKSAMLRLEYALCAHFYTQWQNAEQSDPTHNRELKFLSYVGASLVVDALAFERTLSVEMIKALVDEYSLSVYHRQLTRGWTDHSVGWFNPQWTSYVNYPLAYLLKSSLRYDVDLSVVLDDPAVRSHLLEVGHAHRLIQAYMQNTGVEQDWLDGLLITDIGLGISDILKRAAGSSVESWSDREQTLLRACTDPDLGNAMLVQQLAGLSIADEEEVLRTVGMCFISLPYVSEQTFQLLQVLLLPASLEAIRRYVSANEELILSLVRLLTLVTDLPTDLVHQAKTVVFGLYLSPGNPGEFIERQAAILSRIVGLSRYVVDTQEWLVQLTSDDRINVADVRRGLLQFIRMWRHYPESSRQALGATLIGIAAKPKFAQFWEFERIRRESSQMKVDVP